MYTSITLNRTEAPTQRPSSSIYMCLCVHVKLATRGIPRHPRFLFTGFLIICNMKRIMRCLCKSHRRSPCSADKIHLQIVTPMICCPFHTNFSTINHNKLKPYSYTLRVKKLVIKTANPRFTPIRVDPGCSVDHREVISTVGSRRTGHCARPLWPLVTALSFYKRLALLPSSLFLTSLSVLSNRSEGDLAEFF